MPLRPILADRIPFGDYFQALTPLLLADRVFSLNCQYEPSAETLFEMKDTGFIFKFNEPSFLKPFF